MTDAPTPASSAWYLFVHQVPPNPAYFRARVLRQLTQVGALSVKKSIYVLPASDDTLEDLQWIRQSIVAEGGDAWIFEAGPIAGFTDETLRQLFIEDRENVYRKIAEDAPNTLHIENDSEVEAALRKLERRTEAARRIDFFNANGYSEVNLMLNEIRNRTHQPQDDPKTEPEPAREFYAKRWVTRKGVKVDRIASAWLIAKFIDPAAEFDFVDAQSYVHTPSDLRFDMFEGEFTHVADRCTFESLLDRFDLADPGLRALGEIVHDIDLKDDRYQRLETPGVIAMIDGIVASTNNDTQRLATGRTLLDALYEKLRNS